MEVPHHLFHSEVLGKIALCPDDMVTRWKQHVRNAVWSENGKMMSVLFWDILVFPNIFGWLTHIRHILWALKGQHAHWQLPLRRGRRQDRARDLGQSGEVGRAMAYDV